MISVHEAKHILETQLPKGKSKPLSLTEAMGCILAEDIHSPMDVPSFDNSAMDGYAVALQASQSEYKVVDEVAAGDKTLHQLSSGKASRIFTGAPIPQGADTVVPQEFVKREGNVISFDPKQFPAGSNVRLKGAQTKKGDQVLSKGAVISPGTIGLLASIGVAEISVFQSPSVAIILTGTELQELGKPLEFGQIYNANGPILEAYLKRVGIENQKTFHAPDDPKKLQAVIDEVLADFEVIIFSGGISVGDYDYVKSGLLQSGVQELFYKVKQKPGKPLFIGKKGNQVIFALPGNPASTLTCFNQYVKPSILQMMGFRDTWKPSASFPLKNEFKKKPGLTFFLKAFASSGHVEVLPGQESFNLMPFGTANCLAEVPENEESLKAGDLVNIYYW